MKNKIVCINLIAILLSTSCKSETSSQRMSDQNIIKIHLQNITKSSQYRNHINVQRLNYIADYIFMQFKKYCDTVYYQQFEVNGLTYKNVIACLGNPTKETIVIGAHYDVEGEQEGADDNASGITGLLEMARILKNKKLHYRLEFVAYSLEEPPFFKTEYMGSYIHAKSLKENQRKITGMICLEMIGYFDNTADSQDYPLGFLQFFYGNKGDFITVVQKFGNGKFGRKVKRGIKKNSLIKTKSFKAPASIPGVDFSDHLNYWKQDYSAVMVTNTAFYRNKNYHQKSDTMETLDLDKMCLVIDQLCLMICKLKVY